MNNVDKQYFDMLRYILKNGVEKKDRTSTGTISVFDYTLKFNMNEGFPLLTSKKMAWKSIVIELLWFLRGDTNIQWLVNNGCMIWIGDAYKKFKGIREAMLSIKAPASEDKLKEYIDWYENVDTREKFIEKIKTDNKFSQKHGDLGPVYGKQWRKWKKGERMIKGCDITTEQKKGREDEVHKANASKHWPVDIIVDQISDLIKNLKENPDSRRLIVNAYNVGELSSMVLPPCHMMFQCYTRELSLKERDTYNVEKLFSTKFNNHEDLDRLNVPQRTLSLKVIIRSNDIFLGNPFNIASYGLLLLLLSKEVNMTPDELILSIGDAHIYTNHIEQCKQQLKQKTFRLPTVTIADKSIFDLEFSDIILNDYESAHQLRASYQINK